MNVGRDFDPSDPGESEIYTLHFRKEIPAGETLVSATWFCVPVDATGADLPSADPAAAARLDGSPVVNGTDTLQRVTNLQPGVHYRLQAIVVTDAGSRASLWSHVPCLAPA